MPRPLDEVLQESYGYNGETSPVRHEFGWGDRFGAAVDNSQAGLYGLAEAMGSDWAGEQRRRNQAEGEIVRQRAIEDTGAPDSYRQVRGLRDAGRYVGGLLVDTAPHLATVAGAGMVAGPVGLGTAAGRLGLAAAVSYPMNAGEILQAQREQAGQTDLPSAAALAVPYTAADMVGVEGALARGTLARNTSQVLDRVGGVRGGLARAGASAGRVAATEAAAETFQEGMSQVGRMAVDPNEEFLSDAARERFAEAAVAGGAMGGVFGGAGGGWRRSTRYQPVDAGPVDLTQRTVTEAPRMGLRLDSYGPADGPMFQRQDDEAAPTRGALPGQYDLFNPDGSATYGADPSFGDTNPLRPMEAEWSTSPGAAAPRGGLPFTRDFDTGRMALRAPTEAGTADMFGGEPRLPAQLGPAPLELTPPGSMGDVNQRELDLQPPAQGFVDPPLPAGRQRGIPGQLPFSANTTSPKGQVLQGLVESLAREGHLEGGADVQASTLIAQGKFAAAKKLVDEALKNKSAADRLIAQAAKIEEKANATATGAGAQSTGNATAGAGVQRSGGQRNAAAVQPAGVAAAAATPAAPGEQAAPAVPTGGPAVRPLEPVTSEALTEAADDAKDAPQYEAALDELYRRWRDDGDAVAEAYFESNAKVPGFAADLARVRERAGETQQPKVPASEGKRGLKLGRVETGKLADEAKATDDILRGLATPKFSLKERRAGGPARTAQLQSMADRIVNTWANKPTVKVVESMADTGVPESISKSWQAHLNRNATATTPFAVFQDGTNSVYLFANAIRSEAEMTEALFHEALGHYGLRGVFGKALIPVLDDLARQRPDLIRKKAKEYGYDVNNAAQRMQAADEVLAELAQTRPELTWVQRAVAAIRTWLRQNLPAVFGASQMTDEEVIRNYILPARGWVERGQRLSVSRLDAEKAAYVDRREAERSSEPTRFSAKNTDADNAIAKGFTQFPGSKTTLGQKIQDGLFNLRESPWALKWVTNDQIAEGYKHLKPVQDINRATMRMASVANRYLEKAAQTTKKWRALPDDVQLAMQKVMLKSTMDQSHVSIKGEDGKYLGVDAALAHPMNNHLEKTPEVKRAFGELYREFHALPAPAKAVYDQVRDDLAKQHDDTLRALRKSVADHYAGQLKRALTDEELTQLANSDTGAKAAFKDSLALAGSPTELRALENLYRALRDLNQDFGTVRGPYFPLVRFGDHVVVMKAQDLVEREMTAQGLRAELQTAIENAPAATDEQAEAYNAKIDELRERYKKAQAEVESAKQDDKKYVVEFYETPAQAERAREALAAKFPGADVYRSVREQYYRALDGASPSFLKDLTDTMGAALDAGDGVTAEAKSSAIQAMKDMYLRRQPERNALRSELKRMNIEGVQDAQMLRGYAQSARNGAWRISRLLHAGEVTQGLAELSEDRRSPDAKHVLNELKSRFVGDIAPPEDNKVLRRAQALTYFAHLGFNLSYYLTNATQAWTTSLPVMAGRHGVVNSANSLAAASKDVIRLLSQATTESIKENGAVVGMQLRLTDEQIQSLAQNEGEAEMLKTLTDDGVIDVTIKHDLGALSDGTSDSMPGKVMEISSALANFPELYNRLSTALAAYRMEYARREGAGEPEAQAQEAAQGYAENIINRTHFNYSPENAPRMMRGQLGRLVFQFKRYQQGMIYLFAKLIKDATNGDADARRSLAYLLGMTTAVGGVAALPIAAPVALAAKVLASAYPDDDEPEWLQQWYNGMKDAVGETAAQALVKGAPTLAGLDVSGKIGQGNLLNPVSFANTGGKETLSSDWWTAVTASLLGPASMLVGKQLEATGQALDGNYGRAAELALPTFMANPIKAYRQADQGLTTKGGDTIMEPEEFGALTSLAKAAGFESVNVSDAYDRRAAYLNMVRGRQDARRALLREYYDAVKSGDSEAMDEVRQRIAEFNERQPADQVKSKDLAASLKQRAQRSAETTGGLRVGKRDAETFNRLMGEE